MTNKIDIMAIGVHPDDVELSCAGTLLKVRAEQKNVAIVHFVIGKKFVKMNG